jgi:hypothetical protein
VFPPGANDELVIDGVAYHIAEHPAAPGMPYGQEGRQAVVYQLVAPDGVKQALKVFKPRYRVPSLVTLSGHLSPLSGLPGLQVCHRTVLTARRHLDLLRQHSDLTYAVLMPWIEGPTWMEVLLDRRPLPPEQSLQLARSFADVLAGMEERGLAHCDLSGSNVLLPALAHRTFSPQQLAIELVDVEQIFGPDLRRPEALPGGSPGYAHSTAGQGLWGSAMDRFAGAVLLAEMLAWCDERVRETAWGESYFDADEMQQDCERARAVSCALRERWGAEPASLFEQAWQSDSLVGCATFGEWLVALPEQVPEMRMAAGDIVVQRGTRASEDDFSPAYREEEHGIQPGGNLVRLRKHPPAEASPAVPQTMPEDALEPPPDAPVDDSSQVAALFNAGVAAYKAGDWAQARELLSEVVRAQPRYSSNGTRAATLLREVAKRHAAAPKQKRRWDRAVAPALLLVLLLISGAVAVYQIQRNAEAEARSQAAATAHTVHAQSTAQANASATMQAAASITALAVKSISTTETEATTEAFQAVSTSTAQALAAAVAETATLSANETTVARASGTAVAWSAATAQAVQAATAQALQQESATAEAQAKSIAQATKAAAAQKAAATSTAQAEAAATAQAVRRARFAEETATARAVAASNPAAPPTQPPPGVVPVPQIIEPNEGQVFDSSSAIVVQVAPIKYPIKPVYYVTIQQDSGNGNFAGVVGVNIGKSPTFRFSSHDWPASSLSPGVTYRLQVFAHIDPTLADRCCDGLNSEPSPWRTFSLRP